MPIVVVAWLVLVHYLGPSQPVLYEIHDWVMFLWRLIIVVLVALLIVTGAVAFATMRGAPGNHMLCKGCEGFRKRINWFAMRGASDEQGVLITCPDCNGEGHVQLTWKSSGYGGRAYKWPVNGLYGHDR
jgi:hypothetical protein